VENDRKSSAISLDVNHLIRAVRRVSTTLRSHVAEASASALCGASLRQSPMAGRAERCRLQF